MKAIWTCKSLDFREITPFEFFLLGASAYSFMKFAPEFTRVLYVDQKSKEVFQKNLMLDLLFNEVHLLEFDQILEKQGNRYWCNPKSYVATIQVEPFITVDNDIVLIKPAVDWFVRNKVQGHIMNSTDIIQQERYKHVPETFDKLCKIDPTFGFMFKPEKALNGGFIYYPDPAIGAVVGNLQLSLQSRFYANLDFYKNALNLQESEFSWLTATFIEEGIIGGIFSLIGVDLEDVSFKPDIRDTTADTYMVHQFRKRGTLEEFSEEVNLYQKILRVDIQDRFYTEGNGNNRKRIL